MEGIVSCFVFLFFGISTLALLMAYCEYKNSLTPVREVIGDHVNKDTESFMFLAGYVTTAISIICNIFIRCHITHSIFALMVFLTLGIVIPVISSWGLVLSGMSPSTDANSTMEKISEVVEEHWASEGQVWPYLETLQISSRCCGLDGPLDYREYIYGTGSEGCEQQKFDFPLSCVDMEHHYVKCWYFHRKDHCNLSKVRTGAVVLEDSSENLELDDPKRLAQICNPLNQDKLAINLEGERNETLWREGCLDKIVSNMVALQDTCNIFFWLQILFAFIMLVTYANLWYDRVKQQRRKLKDNNKIN